MKYSPTILVPSSSSPYFINPTHMGYYPMILVPYLQGSSSSSTWAALAQNQDNFSYNPCFFIYSVVLGSCLALYCLVQLTRTHEIFSYEHYSRNYSVLKAVQQSWTIHLTHKILSYNPSSFNYSIVQQVQQGWSTSNYEIFFYDTCSLHYSIVQAVWLGWSTKLMKSSLIISLN